jgi:hypothetical protein
MGTKNNPGRFDCYANAEPDEPMFILLGRDPCARDAIITWVGARMEHMGDDPTSDKIKEALVCSRAMEEWAQFKQAAKKYETWAAELGPKIKAPHTWALIEQAVRTNDRSGGGELVSIPLEEYTARCHALLDWRRTSGAGPEHVPDAANPRERLILQCWSASTNDALKLSWLGATDIIDQAIALGAREALKRNEDASEEISRCHALLLARTGSTQARPLDDILAGWLDQLEEADKHHDEHHAREERLEDKVKTLEQAIHDGPSQQRQHLLKRVDEVNELKAQIEASDKSQMEHVSELANRIKTLSTLVARAHGFIHTAAQSAVNDRARARAMRLLHDIALLFPIEHIRNLLDGIEVGESLKVPPLSDSPRIKAEVQVKDLPRGQAILISGGRLTEDSIKALEEIHRCETGVVIVELETDDGSWKHTIAKDADGRLTVHEGYAEPSERTTIKAEDLVRLIRDFKSIMDAFDLFRERVSEAYDIIVKAATPTVAEMEPRDLLPLDNLQDLLSLVIHPEPPPLSVLETWTDEQRHEAEEWAAAVHVHASDNDDVVVPPKPSFLAEYHG